MSALEDKIKSRPEMLSERGRLRRRGLRLVFTNGCFDLLHPGHVRYLEQAKSHGDVLLVALNSDASVRRLKGSSRPVQDAPARALVMAALASVDYVTFFEEDTPAQIIDELVPDVLVKGGDWPLDQIVGRETVEGAGGQVLSIDFQPGHSTTDIIQRIRHGAGNH
ncbi:MAG TPA: D-glycero-beta-D-manno-heptose 1-phosphate adenylyltransferase [Acidobacteriota bacterium]|nr:D-glycero-beta-D-manno-heptose 1-phosphate adenylyltransferase [Acidobacteriota bacterium]